MPLEIVTVPCLSDNYAYLVNGPDGVAVIDAPEAGPIAAALDERCWTPGVVMLTHHHFDHVQAVEALRKKYGCKVMGPKAEADKMPPLDMALEAGFEGGSGDGLCRVIAVPGHTLGHVAYYYPQGRAVFTADSLMALGCGRLFEGTPEQMWQSLQKLAALPADTMVYSGHEYTQANGAFAVTIEPENPALQARVKEIAATRAAGRPTVPSSLQMELDTNPFLRAGEPAVKAALGMEDIEDVEVFAEIRKRKDNF
ncbi:hydroxyacylglutathione hydrolase [Roseobacteraceae bacterium NS-SX3]